MTKPGRNDPCPCGSGKKYKHCHLGKPDDTWSHSALVVAVPAFPSPADYTYPDRDIDDIPYPDDEDAWEDLPAPEYTKLDEAWDVVDETWSEPNPKKKVKLAREALRISPDCCGAYLVLGILEPNPSARLEIFDQAIAAAERALSPRNLAELAPDEWIEPEVEHGLWAMLHRALTLTELERVDEAVEIYRQLIELDPRDRLTVRLPLFLQLIVNEDLDAAVDVEYESGVTATSDPTWAFARALLKLLREGDSALARRALADAIILCPEESGTMHRVLAELAESEIEGSDEAEFDEETLEFDQELVSELIKLNGINEGPADPIFDLLDLFNIGLHAVLWQTSDGAGAWFERVYDAGPSVRYDNGKLGDGPMLSIPIDKQVDYRHCPKCHKPNKYRPTDIVLQLEVGPIVCYQMNARYCPACDVVCVAFEDFARQITLKNPEGYERDFISLGYIASLERRDDADAEWLLEHLRPWRKIEDHDSDRLDWPTIEEQYAEIDEMLKKIGDRGLLGPVPARRTY